MNKLAKGYVSARLAYHQTKAIRDRLIEQGIEPIAEDKFHTTIAYDRDTPSDIKEPDVDPDIVYEGKVVSIELMGPCKEGLQSAIAFVMDSPQLVEEHHRWQAVGYDHHYPDYIPHVSIAYDVPYDEAVRACDLFKDYIGKTFYFNGVKAEPIEKD